MFTHVGCGHFEGGQAHQGSSTYTFKSFMKHEERESKETGDGDKQQGSQSYFTLW